MKVSIILLDYLRHDHTDQVKGVNMNNAGYPFELIVIDRKGVSAAINDGIKQAMDNGADAVVTMANDILMPDQWLSQMVLNATHIPETGTIGIHCVENIGQVTQRGGFDIYEWPVAFGNVLIPKNTIDKIGYFNTDFDPYGTQDSDYAYRATKAGLIHYYLFGMKSQHIGHDVGNKSEYRKMKDESLAKAGEKALHWNHYYEQTGSIYLPYEQETSIINMEQFYGETV